MKTLRIMLRLDSKNFDALECPDFFLKVSNSLGLVVQIQVLLDIQYLQNLTVLLRSNGQSTCKRESVQVSVRFLSASSKRPAIHLRDRGYQRSLALQGARCARLFRSGFFAIGSYAWQLCTIWYFFQHTCITTYLKTNK